MDITLVKYLKSSIANQFGCRQNAFVFYFLCDMPQYCGRRGGLMVSVLDPGASGPGSGPGRGHCVVFLGKKLNSHGAFLHQGL